MGEVSSMEYVAYNALQNLATLGELVTTRTGQDGRYLDTSLATLPCYENTKRRPRVGRDNITVYCILLHDYNITGAI